MFSRPACQLRAGIENIETLESKKKGGEKMNKLVAIFLALIVSYAASDDQIKKIIENWVPDYTYSDYYSDYGINSGDVDQTEDLSQSEPEESSEDLTDENNAQGCNNDIDKDSQNGSEENSFGECETIELLSEQSENLKNHSIFDSLPVLDSTDAQKITAIFSVTYRSGDDVQRAIFGLTEKNSPKIFPLENNAYEPVWIDENRFLYWTDARPEDFIACFARNPKDRYKYEPSDYYCYWDAVYQGYWQTLCVFDLISYRTTHTLLWVASNKINAAHKTYYDFEQKIITLSICAKEKRLPIFLKNGRIPLSVTFVDPPDYTCEPAKDMVFSPHGAIHPMNCDHDLSQKGWHIDLWKNYPENFFEQNKKLYWSKNNQIIITDPLKNFLHRKIKLPLTPDSPVPSPDNKQIYFLNKNCVYVLNLSNPQNYQLLFRYKENGELRHFRPRPNPQQNKLEIVAIEDCAFPFCKPPKPKNFLLVFDSEYESEQPRLYLYDIDSKQEFKQCGDPVRHAEWSPFGFAYYAILENMCFTGTDLYYHSAHRYDVTEKQLKGYRKARTIDYWVFSSIWGLLDHLEINRKDTLSAILTFYDFSDEIYSNDYFYLDFYGKALTAVIAYTRDPHFDYRQSPAPKTYISRNGFTSSIHTQRDNLDYPVTQYLFLEKPNGEIQHFIPKYDDLFHRCSYSGIEFDESEWIYFIEEKNILYESSNEILRLFKIFRKNINEPFTEEDVFFTINSYSLSLH